MVNLDGAVLELTKALDVRNAELDHSNAALADFAYVASHDLREPLRTVTSYTQLLTKRYGDKFGDEGAEFIAIAADAAKRLEHLVSGLTEYASVGGQRTAESVESKQELDTALNNLAANIEETGASIDAGPLPPVLAKPGQLAIVFQNLIGNALKYSGARKAIVAVDAQRQGSKWVFSVRDNGIGIASEHYERIFKMFQRLHARGDYEGSGIGLAVVKRIIDLQGGRIWVESQVGEGSAFFFTMAPVV